MPTTNIELPNSHADIGNEIGDGITYGNISNTSKIRFLETTTGTGALTMGGAPRGVRFFNFFNTNQIPLDATISGIEVVAGPDPDNNGNSRLGSFGTNSVSFDLECYLHNGTSYSSKLVWDSSDPGDAILSNGDTTATFSGAGKDYKNDDTNTEVLFGGTNDLSGLTWDPTNQSNFGFVITCPSGDTGFIGGAVRGIGLRITYKEAIKPKVTLTNQGKITIQSNTKVKMIKVDPV